MIDFSTKSEKYKYLVGVLEKVESDKLYKEEVIENNPELEAQREKDIKELKELICKELQNDGINTMFVRGRLIKKSGF